jgi:F-type H+-transporting ATPase subunit delta
MTSKTAAIRYARALFDVARQERADLDRIDEELAGFVALFEQHPNLKKVLLNPAIPVARKRAAMLELTTRAATSPVVAKLLALLAERDRLILLPELLASYRERLLDYKQIVRAEVTTATPIASDKADAIARRLAGATGRNVALTTSVDPAIIGGLVARVGSTVYDASITRQLEKMRQRLEQGG